jgi:hypothetical protein
MIAYLILSYILGALTWIAYAAVEDTGNSYHAGRNMIRAASLLPLAPLLMPLLVLAGLVLFARAAVRAWRDE